MRFLVVMRCCPFSPGTGSTIVAYNTMKQLSKNHKIDFICLQPTEVLAKSPEFIENAEFVPHNKSTYLGGLFKKTFDALLGVPPLVSEYRSKDMKIRVREAIEHFKFDAIILFEMNAIQYCPSFYYNKMVVNIEDPQSLRLRRMAALPVWSLWQKMRLLVIGKITELYERRVLPQIEKVLLLSESDMRDMQEQGGYNNLGVMSYGISKVSIKNILAYEERTEGMIVFTGNMFHPPNVDGALYFLQEIFPLVLQEHPTTKLWIIGANPDIRIRDMAVRFGERVVITGQVLNMAEYLQTAKISICPVRLKIGVQTKILEALSWGTPVVTTSAGNSGIGGCAGSELWVEDEPNSFACRVVELLRGENWNRLSEEGRKLAEKKFSWESSAEQLNKHIELLNLKNC